MFYSGASQSFGENMLFLKLSSLAPVRPQAIMVRHLRFGRLLRLDFVCAQGTFAITSAHLDPSSQTRRIRDIQRIGSAALGSVPHLSNLAMIALLLARGLTTWPP